MNQKLKATISTAVAKFVYYDRKEDEDLPRHAIEDMIARGETSVDEIVAEFTARLKGALE